MKKLVNIILAVAFTAFNAVLLPFFIAETAISWGGYIKGSTIYNIGVLVHNAKRWITEGVL